MDGSPFDRWTRRRFGLAGGGLAALLALGRLKGTGGKKRGKKRCRKLLQSCSSGGKRKCCGKLRCGVTDVGFNRCCKRLDAPCAKKDECCTEAGTNCVDGFCKIV